MKSLVATSISIPALAAFEAPVFLVHLKAQASCARSWRRSKAMELLVQWRHGVAHLADLTTLRLVRQGYPESEWVRIRLSTTATPGTQISIRMSGYSRTM